MVAISLNPLPRSRVVRVMVWVNCAVLIVGGFISFFANLLSFFDLTLPVLSAYIFLFGCIATAAEIGLDFAKSSFGFLLDWVGEGLFFIFIGTLGISFFPSSLFVFIIGIYSTVVGVLCLVDHLFWSRATGVTVQGDAAPQGATPTPLPA